MHTMGTLRKIQSLDTINLDRLARRIMALRQWKLQDAKNNFSEVVKIAMEDGPQEVTKHGEHAVVILSFALYQELSRPRENLVEFFRSSPFYGAELDLERSKDIPREFEF